MAAKKAAKKKARTTHRAAVVRGHHKPANSNEPHLSSRPIWQGNLRLSLVSCPVALYGATDRGSDVSFHLLNPETNNRIRMIPTDPDTGPVDRPALLEHALLSAARRKGRRGSLYRDPPGPRRNRAHCAWPGGDAWP
jgi:hypothetical protein